MTRTRVRTPRASATAGRGIAGATGQRPGRMLLAGEHRRLVRNERASQQDRPGRRPAEQLSKYVLDKGMSKCWISKTMMA